MAGAFKVEAVHAATAKSFAEIEQKRVAEEAVERQPDREGRAAEEIL